MMLLYSLLVTLSCLQTVSSFTNRPRASFRSSSRLSLHRGLRLPLLDLTGSEHASEMIVPLPSSHLPDELTTLNVYGMQLTRPAHQMIVDQAVEAEERLFGHVAYKTSQDDLTGAIGCAAEVLLKADALEEVSQSLGQGHAPPATVLCRGSFRFIVKEVIKSIPFPIAIVDELEDGEPGSGNMYTKPNVLLRDIDNESNVDEEEDESDIEDDEADGDDDYYASLSVSELVQRMLIAMKQHVDQQLSVIPEDMSPLEQAILEESNLPGLDTNAQHQAAEEMAAVFEVFAASIGDLFGSPKEQYYAIAMMAAEMINAGNQVRMKILAMTDGVERMRLVLRKLEDMVGMAQARKIAHSITDEKDELERDLQVGDPELPPWAKQIRKGMRLEYFWNEEWGWCEGEVIEEPLKIVDEILLTVHFASDGSTHRLPVTAEEKVRWRPPQRE